MVTQILDTTFRPSDKTMSMASESFADLKQCVIAMFTKGTFPTGIDCANQMKAVCMVTVVFFSSVGFILTLLVSWIIYCMCNVGRSDVWDVWVNMEWIPNTFHFILLLLLGCLYIIIRMVFAGNKIISKVLSSTIFCLTSSWEIWHYEVCFGDLPEMG